MDWSLKLIDPPDVEPFTEVVEGSTVPKDAKLFLRVDHNDEDVLIKSYIAAVRSFCENWQNRAYITQEWRLTLDNFPNRDYILIPRPPLQSIETFTYKDKDGDTHNFEDYEVDTDSEPGRVYLSPNKEWPTVDLFPKAAVTIEFKAGYGDDADNIPEEKMQAMRLLLGEWYEMREAVIVGSIVNELPFAVESLMWQDRIFPFHPAGEE